MKKHFLFQITNQCNLRCPTCAAFPLGRNGRLDHADMDTCEKVFSHMRRHFGESHVCLYTLNEPLLHPEICGVLELAGRYGHRFELSSNLNVDNVDLERILAFPNLIRMDVSVSGFTQDVYALGHSGGNIDLVKRNLLRMSNLQDDMKRKVHIKFHLYNDNAGDERKFADFCSDHGFGFSPAMACTFQEGRYLKAFLSGTPVALPERMRRVFCRLCHAPEDYSESIPAFEKLPCFVLEQYVYIGHDGRLKLCCVAENYVETADNGFFFEKTPEEILEGRRRDPICGTCRKHGLHARWNLRNFFLGTVRVHDAPEDYDPWCGQWDAFVRKDFATGGFPAVWVYGAGVQGEMFAQFFAHLGLRVRGFIDDAPEKRGTEILGLPILPPEGLAGTRGEKAAVVSCMFVDRARHAALDAGLFQGTGLHLQPLHEFVRHMLDAS